MQRRSFLKLVAASFMVPCVQLRREIDRESLILAFCDTDSFRYDFDRPFAIGSLTYATDSRHMVRAELSNRREDGERRLPENVEECFNKYWNPGEWRPFELPPIESLVKYPVEMDKTGMCPLCGDRWIFLGDRYPNEDEMEHLRLTASYDVDTNEIRDTSCQLCHGRDYYGPSSLEVCGVLLSYHRLKPIAAIPGVMVAANQNRDQDSPILFRGCGIDGMAMGLATH